MSGTPWCLQLLRRGLPQGHLAQKDPELKTELLEGACLQGPRCTGSSSSSHAPERPYSPTGCCWKGNFGVLNLWLLAEYSDAVG